jgi:hypothetical protein
MKKFYMTMVALLCGVAAMAQNELYVPEVTMKAGDKGVIEICLRNESATIQQIAFKLKTVTGVKLTTKAADFTIVEDRLDLDNAKIAAKAYLKKQLDNEEIEEGEYNDGVEEIEDFSYSDLFEVAKNGSIYSFGTILSAAAYKNEAGEMVYTAFKGNDGALLKCPVSVNADAAEGVYELQLTDIVIAGDPVDNIAKNLATETTATIKVTVGDGTGINSINAADSKAPVYNLAGQRVSNAQKGVFIQSGKKVAVK